MLGGVVDDSVLSALSRIAGTRTIVQESVSTNRRGDQPGRSYAEREENVLEKSQIETMRRGLACVVEATKHLIVVELEPVFRRYPTKKKDREQGDSRPVAAGGSAGIDRDEHRDPEG